MEGVQAGCQGRALRRRAPPTRVLALVETGAFKHPAASPDEGHREASRMLRMRARLARLLRRRRAEPPVDAQPSADPAGRARDARIAAAHTRAWARRLAERARGDAARTAIVAALLATEQAAALHAARAPAPRRSGGGPPLLH
jgi:hypothetical protein